MRVSTDSGTKFKLCVYAHARVCSDVEEVHDTDQHFSDNRHGLHSTGRFPELPNEEETSKCIIMHTEWCRSSPIITITSNLNVSMVHLTTILV